MSNRRRDGAKLSFAELDKLRRERNHGSGQQERTPRAPQAARAQKSYRAALERAFDSGTLAEFAATMQRARNPLASPLRGAPGPADTAGPQPAQALRMEAASNQPGDKPGHRPDSTPAAEPDASASIPAVTTPAAPAQPSQRAEQRQLAAQTAKKMAKKIAEATAPREVAKAAERYLAHFGSLPRDLDLLEKLLGHPKTALVLSALETLESITAKQKPRRSRSLSVQLSILEETHEDSEVRELAARLRATL